MTECKTCGCVSPHDPIDEVPEHKKCRKCGEWCDLEDE